MSADSNRYPHDFTIENAMIGWVLCDNKIMAQLGNIQPEHFYSAPHADIWQAMETLFISGKQISPFTIKPLLKNPEAFEEMGGAIKYISSSIQSTYGFPYPKEQETYLIKLAQQRKLFEVCDDALGYDLHPSDAARRLADVAGEVLNSRPVDEFIDNLRATENIIEELKSNKRPDATGMKLLDEAMEGGFYAGKTYGIAARKKMGKTALAATLSHNLNMSGVKHVFICCEMSPEEIQQRVIARAVGCYASDFRNDRGRTSKFMNQIAEYARLMPKNVIYKNAPGTTFDELKYIYSSAIDRHGVKGIILDYWQLIGGKQKGQSDASHLDEVAQWIADYSRKRGVWSLVMAQINQEGNTRGGEGMRLAFDQVYCLQSPEDDPSRSVRWLDMMETRYTGWKNIGSENSPRLQINPKGVFMEEI